MSLKNYLFYLMGGLILLLSLSQIGFIYWAKNYLDQEVQVKAQNLSRQVLNFTLDNLSLPMATTDDENANKVSSTKQKTFKIESESLVSDVEVVHIIDGKSGKNVSVINPHGEGSTGIHPDFDQIRKNLKLTMDKLHKRLSQSDGTDQLLFTQGGSSKTKVKTWQFNSSGVTHTSDKFIQVVLLIILASTLMALGFAYWLSHKFSQPMRALSDGFSKLSKGNYQDNVTEQGVTEIRQTISDFNQMKSRLKQLSSTEKKNQELQHMAELGEVTLGLAHALRNPIHTIGLSVEQLNDIRIEPSQKQTLVDKIQAKIRHIDKTIHALLSLTTTGIRRDQTVVLLPVVQDIQLEVKATDIRGLNLEVNIDSVLSIVGSDNEVRAILHTLIINACEASDAGQTVTIEASEKGTDGQVIIIVSDQGTGIEESIQNELFQPHVSSKAEGAGMGLYIAQRLMTLFYQGHISLQNNQPAGCIATAVFYSRGDHE